MNNTETQPRALSKKEYLKKASQYSGTLLGASALVAAGILAVNNPDKDPKEQSISKVNGEAPTVVPGTHFDMLKGTALELRPSPRRKETPVPTTANPTVDVPSAQSANETNNTNSSNPHETTHKHHPRINLGNDVVVQTPPTTESPGPIPETPAPTPIIVD